MLCGLCNKRNAVQTYLRNGEIKIDICEECAKVLHEKNIRNHYGGQIYEFIKQLKQIRQTQDVKKIRSKTKLRKHKKISA